MIELSKTKSASNASKKEEAGADETLGESTSTERF
jgi:hypothetical protein